ncbi:hypothetical protein [Pedobacter hiemivivus]|uniref:Outer membrane protein beta-barrel domain-containing protein n=1 Tax=Pedobacter hiemivivus TaxID=2530454 RepID=A0A4R0NKW7_9SPHI|nr:hypothetical protein [Pedobacter hiemivivus]TCC99634.1 hypothetical protein EZ444_02895 [Pedobacter hiemivivus]
MKKLLLISLLFLSVNCVAQTTAQPFLFNVNTLTGDKPYWNLQYSGSYGERATGQFGYDGLGQQFGLKSYLGNRFTLYATAAVGFANGGGVSSAQQAEVLRDFIGGKKAEGFRLGAGLGASRDWSNVKSAISRIALSFDQQKWRAAGNLRFEKAFDSSRDKLDFISSLGFQYRLAPALFLGFEAIGQDLEGFWDKEEAEGGAKLMVGPSINLKPQNSRLSFSIAGGPVFYATRSNIIPSEAIRELGASANGYSLRALVNFELYK